MDDEIPAINARSKKRLVVQRARRTMVRIELVFPLETIGDLEALMNRTGQETFDELLKNVICFFELAIQECLEGSVIVSYDQEQRTMTQPVNDILSNAAAYGRLQRVPEITELESVQ